MSWIDIVKAIGPALLAAKVPHGADIAPLVIHGIEVAESLKGVKSSEKLQAARDLAITGAKAVNAAYGKPKLNIDAIDGSIDNGINAVVSVANAVTKAKQIPVKSTDSVTTKPSA